MKDMMSNIISALLLGLIIVAVVYVWNWKDFKKQEIKNTAIQGCAEVGSRSNSTGGFNGAAYKICVEDKGYTTKIQ